MKAKMNKQVKEKLKEQEEAKDAEANEKAALLAETEEVVSLDLKCVTDDAAEKTAHAISFKYLEAYMDWMSSKELVDNMRKEVSEVDGELQVKVKEWFEQGRPKHKRPTGEGAETAIALMENLPHQTVQLRNAVRKVNFFAEQFEFLRDEVVRSKGVKLR